MASSVGTHKLLCAWLELATRFYGRVLREEERAARGVPCLALLPWCRAVLRVQKHASKVVFVVSRLCAPIAHSPLLLLAPEGEDGLALIAHMPV